MSKYKKNAKAGEISQKGMLWKQILLRKKEEKNKNQWKKIERDENYLKKYKQTKENRDTKYCVCSI